MKNTQIPLPRALILLSPLVNNKISSTLTKKETSYHKSDTFDIFTIHEDFILSSLYCQSENPEHPYISPIFGDLRDLPPTLIQVYYYQFVFFELTFASNWTTHHFVFCSFPDRRSWESTRQCSWICAKSTITGCSNHTRDLWTRSPLFSHDWRIFQPCMSSIDSKSYTRITFSSIISHFVQDLAMTKINDFVRKLCYNDQCDFSVNDHMKKQ